MSPPNIPATLEDQLALLTTYLDELEPYLMSQELFWPIGSMSAHSPKLTIGNLLLTLSTVETKHSALDANQQGRLHHIQTRWNQASKKWASAISSKAIREMGARLNLWQAYLADLDEGQGRRYLYSTEVRNRVLFELLVSLTANDAEVVNLRNTMLSLDSRMQALTQPAPFQWEEFLLAEYGPTTFPFLYRTTSEQG